jgi:hypothetical protein
MGVSLTIRPATSREREEAARQWVSSFSPGARDVTIGSTARTLVQRHWKRAHRALVAQLLSESECHVIVLDDIPNEPLGWVCFEPGGELHYAYVVSQARLRGLGSKLVTWARTMGAGHSDLDISHMTAGGRKLVHDEEEAQAETPAASRLLDG